VTRPLLADLLLDWYQKNARDLPWRGHPDPYTIWVSEIMLQQTRVETVIPYFTRWMERFPTIQSLAEAPQQAILSAWEGLGYYRRAHHLQMAAITLVKQYGGKLPQDAKKLQLLPGVGRYTAGAIASMAFGLDEPALDGNIRRVLARVYNVSEPARSSAGEKLLWLLARENLPSGQASEYNQALMDLGALICTPRDPDCPACPLQKICAACELGIQSERPVVSARPETPHYTVTAAIIERENCYLLAQRPADGLLGGLWEFPGGKTLPGEDLETCLQREICEELGVDIQVGEPLGKYRHAYTHFKVTLYAYRCSLATQAEPQPIKATSLRWVPVEALSDFPMGKIDRQIAVKLASSQNGSK
jgi:A/G-specific adenine glycosylase